MARVRLTFLGGFQARSESGDPLPLPARKAQALLAYLAVPPGQAHPRDKLAALLWGDTTDEQARASLRQALFALRRALPPSTLVTEGETVALDPAAAAVDVAAFERQAAEGTPEALAQAAALYQGDLLAGLAVTEAAFEEWLLAERERLRELALEGLAKLLAHQRTARAPEPAVQTALKLLALDPLQEPVHRTLMRLYAQLGRRGAALRQYQACVAVLQRELGVEPEAETRQLYQEILRQLAPRPTAPVADAVAVRVDHPGGETPSIGREAEIGRLREALERAAGGRGRLVAVLGEAGIGKSRLVAELAADATHRNARVLLGRAYESEQTLAFGPWVDAFRTGQVLDDAELRAGLGTAWRAELGRVFPEWGDPASPTSTDTPDQRRLFEAIAHLVTHLAARQPLVVILEDLHWADEVSLRLLAFLGRRLEAWRVLVLATAREEELAGAPGLRQALQELRREERLVELVVPPLSRLHTERLVRTLAKSGTEESAAGRLGDRIWRLSEGNPFVVVEVMRAVAEGMAPEASALSVPERVREVIAGRLERLSEPSGRLVAVAAVIGREFEFALLCRAAGLGEGEAAERMEELVRRRILQGVGERFDFTHDRIRAVAYAQLIPPRRTFLHRQVAEALEAVYAANLEPHALALGLHHREGEVWDKAVTYLRQAGHQAAARAAYREAVACFDQALVATRQLPQTPETFRHAIDLRFDLRETLYPLGEFERVLTCVQDAERLAAALDDQPRLGRASAYMSHYYRQIGRCSEARSFAERAHAIAEALADRPLAVLATFLLGFTYYDAGDYRQAVQLFRRTTELLEGDLERQRIGMPGFPAATSRHFLAHALAERGEFEEGLRRAREGLALAETLDHPYTLAMGYSGVGFVYGLKGEFGHAAHMFERGLDLCRQWSITLQSALMSGALGYAYARSGRVEEGSALMQRALATVESLGWGGGHSARVVQMGEAYLLAHRIEDALAHAERGLTLARARGERGYEAQALRLLGEIAARRGEAGAADHYRGALALASQLGMRPLEAHCRLGLGRLTRDRGELDAAVALFRAMDMTYWLPGAEAELATLGG